MRAFQNPRSEINRECGSMALLLKLMINSDIGFMSYARLSKNFKIHPLFVTIWKINAMMTYKQIMYALFGSPL